MELKEKRDRLKSKLKEFVNPYFGSVFRTADHRTSFFTEVSFYADLYTSSLESFMSYNLDHAFYSQRGVMPHDYIEEK